jgi:beta-glucosidase
MFYYLNIYIALLLGVFIFKKIKKTRMKYLNLLLILSISSIGILNAQAPKKKATPSVATAKKDAIDVKVEALLAKMNLDEKIGQITLFTSDWDVTGPTIRKGYADDIRKGKCGNIFNAHTAAYNRKLQEIAVKETRLGIPLLFGYDVIHGYKTIFPIPLGEAASWDLEAIEKSARIAAEEASAAGLHWTFAPMVDISRDPRWGRCIEGAGEDVYLGSQISAARTRGFQGTIGATNSLVACTKHFAAYGAAQAGRDYHTVDIGNVSLWETYLPPYKASIDAGALTVMTSFNEIDGIPSTASKMLLTDILRKKWGFKGFVVTDYTSINEMVNHGNVKDDKDAGEKSINAGVDMDMQGAVFYNYIAKSLAEGKVSMKTIDDAVRRILRVKYQIGLFDDPYKFSDEAREKRVVFSAENQAAARDIARKSMVLLKNDKNTLPLSKSLKTLAVIGPLADSKADMLGSWSGAGDGNSCISLLEGIKNVAPSVNIVHVKGCDLENTPPAMNHPMLSTEGIANAVKAANQADAVVVAVGERGWMTGEAASRADIGLPGVQNQLILELIKTGKPVVVVLINGRPLTFPEVAEKASAILETWFGGTQGGNAIADILFGDYNPSGKLPMTFPRAVGQVPIFYSAKNTGRPMDVNNKYTSKYMDLPNSPQYPFGFGLSYTNFDYSIPVVDKTNFNLNDKINIAVTVKNTGNRDGEEVVQLYVRDLVGSLTRPLKELKKFQKIMLKQGESKTVNFTLTQDDLGFYHTDLKKYAEAGDFEIMVGGNSDDVKKIRITATAPNTKPIRP